MRFLPCIFLILLLFGVFLRPGMAMAAAQNPQNIFEPLPDLILSQDEAERTKATEENSVQVSILGTQKAGLYYGAFALTDSIICLQKDSVNPNRCKDKAPYTVMGALAQTMGVMYDHPPASGIAWTKDALAHAGFIKPAYAQGVGFAALTPFLPLWKTTRNISYAILIIVMVTIGFMVIFRMKIDPKTVISVQAALPKIVLSLILITLSYPIVGFLVDLMYLSMAILVSIFVNGVGGSLAGYNVGQWQTDTMTGGMGTLFTTVFGGGFRSADDFALKFFNIEGITGAGTAIGVGWAGIMTGWNILLGGLLGAAALPILFVLIIALGLLFIFIRLLMILANSYIQLIISLILAPILLLNEAIPGRSGFKNWISTILANLSVFPATALILMFATYLTTAGIGGTWSPPFLGFPIQGSGQGFFSAFMGLSMIFISPNLVVAVKKMFQAKPALPISAGTVLSPVTGGVQTTMGLASQYYYMQTLPFVGRFLGAKGGGGGPGH